MKIVARCISGEDTYMGYMCFCTRTHTHRDTCLHTYMNKFLLAQLLDGVNMRWVIKIILI